MPSTLQTASNSFKQLQTASNSFKSSVLRRPIRAILLHSLIDSSLLKNQFARLAQIKSILQPKGRHSIVIYIISKILIGPNRYLQSLFVQYLILEISTNFDYTFKMITPYSHCNGTHLWIQVFR